MLPKTISENTIRALHELFYKLYDIDIHIPTQKQLEKNQARIEDKLPPPDPDRHVRWFYAIQVSVAYEYARVHYRDGNNSLLSDIESGQVDVKTVDLSKYKFRLENQ